MKKTISFLLVFCLFAFSLFSTGCGSSSGGAFKFIGAALAITVALSSGGAASSAVFAANLRGDKEPTKLDPEKIVVNVYELDELKPDLHNGTAVNTTSSEIVLSSDKKSFTYTTSDNIDNPGYYIIEVSYDKNDIKPFLRGIVYVGNKNTTQDVKVDPKTEVETTLYKNWVDSNPEVTSYENFKANLKTVDLTTVVETYEKKLSTWDTAEKLAGTADVEGIDVPKETKVDVKNNPIPGTTRPADLQSATWRTITANDIDGKQFVKRYMFDTDKKWIKFTNEGTDNLPNITFTDQSVAFHGYHKMTISYYSEDTMNGWAPVNNKFEIPETDKVNRITDNDRIYIVSSDLKIVVKVFDDVGRTTEFICDAKITSHNSKTYLHVKYADDEGIYELIPRDNNPIPNTTRPADLQSATWTTITAANIVGKQFVMRYILDTDTNTWVKFTNEDIQNLPIIMLI
ncbi:MAG: hypothetical protein ACOX2I_02560 [Candidatus Ozemobacteraceae bacterium]